MAQFATRFEDSPLGSAPVGWTAPWGTNTWTVGEYAELGGGRGIRTAPSGSGVRRCLLWHHAGLPGDVEILTAGMTTDERSNQLRLHARTWGRPGAESGVYCELFGGDTFSVSGYVEGASATISGPSSAAFAWSPNTLYWMRLRLEGAVVRAKVWEDGTSEPADWTVERVIEDPELLEPGNVGLGFFTTAGTKHFIGLAVGTDGDEATFAAGQPEPETHATVFAEFGEGPLPPELIQPFLGSSEPAARIVRSGDGESHLGDRYIVQEPLTSEDGHRHLRWIRPEAANATQILARVRSLVGGPGLLGPGLNSWGEGAGNNSQHSAVIRGPSTVEINRHQNGVFSVDTSVTWPLTVGTWYWIRLEAEPDLAHSSTGLTRRAKFWEDGTAEPAEWDLETRTEGAQARPLFGWAGTYITSGARRHEIDFLSVANRGATAPGPEAIRPLRPSLTALGTELYGSLYVHPLGVAHRASRWQVALADSDFSDPVWDSGLTEQDLVSVSPAGLTPGLSYRARVLYQDANGNLSEWSEVVPFDAVAGWAPCHPFPPATPWATRDTSDQRYESFAGFRVGANLRDHGWDEIIIGPNESDWWIRAEPDAPGGKIVEPLDRPPVITGFDPVFDTSVPRTVDQRVVVRVRHDGEPGILAGAAARILGEPGAASGACYIVVLAGSGTLELRRRGEQDGSPGALLDSMPFPFLAGEWYDVELEAIGSTLRGRAWRAGFERPGWMVGAMDAVIPEGVPGMVIHNNTSGVPNNVQFAFVAWGLNDSPLPPAPPFERRALRPTTAWNPA